MKPSTKPSQKSAETIYAELKADIRSGLSLIDATVNSLAKAKFILQNCLEQSQQLYKATNSSSLSKNGHNSSKKPQPRRRSSSNEILIKKKSSSSSSSSSTSSCSTCSGGGGNKKKKPLLLLLPSPRGGSLAKYKPQSSLPQKKKKPPPPPIKKVEPWSFYTGNVPSNYLSFLSPKLLKLLDTDRVCKLRLVDCSKPRKRLNSTDTERSSKKDISRASTVIATPTDLTSFEKPSLSIFEELLEKSKPQENRVKIGRRTLEEESSEKSSESTVKPAVKPYKPGPKSKQKVTNDDPSRPDSSFEDSSAPPKSAPPKSSKEPAPPPIKKARIGPKSKTRPPSPPPPPSLPLLPNSEDIKQKLLDSFREFQQRQKSTEVKTEDVLSALSSVGETDTDGWIRFGMDVNSRMARFFATTENSSDSDSESENYSLSEQNRGQFFLSPNGNGSLRLLRYEGPSSFPKFKHLPLSNLSEEELEQFKRDFIT